MFGAPVRFGDSRFDLGGAGAVLGAVAIEERSLVGQRRPSVGMTTKSKSQNRKTKAKSKAKIKNRRQPKI
jgi:hypothetical protein